MKTEILNNLSNPGYLERMYRRNKTQFKNEFNLIYPEISSSETAQAWNERLNYEEDVYTLKSKSDIFFVVAASLIAALIAKIPGLAGLNAEFFYSRNAGLIVFPFIAGYFAMRERIPTKTILMMAMIFLLSALYINILPGDSNTDKTVLACIHLPVVLWGLACYAFTGGQLRNLIKRIDFLRYNGDLLIMSAVIMIAGIAFTGATLALFRLIHVNIEQFYFNNIAVWGLAALPVVATYLVRTNQNLVSKISPVIAKLFMPIVFLTLVIYLLAILFTNRNPYNDREFLLIFNALLIAVMAIILFSVTESLKSNQSKLHLWFLFGLSVVTVIINAIALSAILFRITEWGFTPNRIAVLGSNLLILINLLVVSYRLFISLCNRKSHVYIERSIAAYLPLYIVWAGFITFILPWIF